jgi:acetyl-CoA synthetase
MPMIPEAAYAMLACSRIGASTRSSSAASLPRASPTASRIASPPCVITADEGVRGGKIIPLKQNVDEALETRRRRQDTVIVVTRTGAGVPMTDGRDVVYEDAAADVSECAPEPMSAEDPLFILYTSGSTGKPKGVLHTTGGYLVYAVDDAPIRLRLSRRRHLLVHR